MPFSKELKQKEKLARITQNATPGLKIKKFFGGGSPYPTRWSGPPSNTYPDLALRAKMAAPPPFLVPAIATIVLAISNLNKNPWLYEDKRCKT